MLLMEATLTQYAEEHPTIEVLLSKISISCTQLTQYTTNLHPASVVSHTSPQVQVRFRDRGCSTPYSPLCSEHSGKTNPNQYLEGNTQTLSYVHGVRQVSHLQFCPPDLQSINHSYVRV